MKEILRKNNVKSFWVFLQKGSIIDFWLSFTPVLSFLIPIQKLIFGNQLKGSSEVNSNKVILQLFWSNISYPPLMHSYIIYTSLQSIFCWFDYILFYLLTDKLLLIILLTFSFLFFLCSIIDLWLSSKYASGKNNKDLVNFKLT